MTNTDKLHISLDAYTYIKEAMSRGQFIATALRAPAALIAGPTAVKALGKNVAGSEGRILGSKVISQVTGVDMYPALLKAQANKNLIESIHKNTPVSRRNFINRGMMDTMLHQTPVGGAIGKLAPTAPSLAMKLLSKLGEIVM